MREVSEETGLRVTLGQRLPPVRYWWTASRRWWTTGRPERRDSAGAFIPNHEVDRLDWVALTHATGRLSYDHDAALLADFGAAPRPTVPLILVRHASAGSKSEWHRDDELRPLDSRGKQQAKLLAELLRCFGAGRVLSSPAERCLATVRPYAAAIGAEVEVVPEFGVPPGTLKKAARAATADELGRAAAGTAADSRAAISRSSSARTGRTCRRCWRPAAPGWARSHRKDRRCARADSWVLHRAAGRLAGSECHHPEDLRLSGRGGRCRGLPVQRRR